MDIRLSVIERIVISFIHFLTKAIHFLVLYLIMATYNIGYIVGSAAGYMMGNLVFGLIKDSIVITRVKREKTEVEKKRKEKIDLLKKKKTSGIFEPAGIARANSNKTVDTERDALKS